MAKRKKYLTEAEYTALLQQPLSSSDSFSDSDSDESSDSSTIILSDSRNKKCGLPYTLKNLEPHIYSETSGINYHVFNGRYETEADFFGIFFTKI